MALAAAALGPILADYVGLESQCDASRETLCKRLGVKSESSIERYLDLYEAAELLQLSRPSKYGRKRTTGKGFIWQEALGIDLRLTAALQVFQNSLARSRKGPPADPLATPKRGHQDRKGPPADPLATPERARWSKKKGPLAGSKVCKEERGPGIPLISGAPTKGREEEAAAASRERSGQPTRSPGTPAAPTAGDSRRWDQTIEALKNPKLYPMIGASTEKKITERLATAPTYITDHELAQVATSDTILKQSNPVIFVLRCCDQLGEDFAAGEERKRRRKAAAQEVFSDETRQRFTHGLRVDLLSEEDLKKHPCQSTECRSRVRWQSNFDTWHCGACCLPIDPGQRTRVEKALKANADGKTPADIWAERKQSQKAGFQREQVAV